MTTRRVLCCLAVLACLLGCDKPSATGDSGPLDNLGTVPAFQLTDQGGAAVTPGTLRGTPWVAAFMFTRCPSVCPRITARMKELQAAARTAQKPLRLVSISVDPEYDTPAVLQAYAQKFALDTRSWSLLTGPHEAIVQTAEQGFKIGLDGKADPAKADLGLTHGSHLILVDKNGAIRGYYRSFDEDVVQRLLADLDRL